MNKINKNNESMSAEELEMYIEDCIWYDIHKDDEYTPKEFVAKFNKILDFEDKYGKSYRPLSDEQMKSLGEVA